MGVPCHAEQGLEYLYQLQTALTPPSLGRHQTPSPLSQPLLNALFRSRRNGRHLSRAALERHAYKHPLLADATNAESSARSSSPTATVSPYFEIPLGAEDRKSSKKIDVQWQTNSRQQTDVHNRAPKNNIAGAGSSPMTSNGVAGMRNRKEEGPINPLPARPAFTSHHSNSVPSTPHQHAREFTSRSRSPSPNGGLGNHSPRSVSSEANGALPALRKPRVGCPYETSLAFGRRRIPYTIGSDPLEKAKEEPKRALTAEEDKKLSESMKELYERLIPTKESDERRVTLVKKLERIFHEEWPGNEFTVHVFGSSGNLLCTSESDVDICIQTPMKKLESMHMLADALARHGMERVVCVPLAKVPIVKIWDPQLELACDMNVNNTLALENTRLIRTYVQIDERVRPLAMIVKHWTKQRILNDAALGGTLSSYTWICLILNFLQTRNPPVLPSLHQIPHDPISKVTGRPTDFADDLDQLQGYGKDNHETLGQLLFHFFRRYGHEIDYETSVVSVRQGRLLTRKEKGWDLESLTKEGRDRLCVEEPFNVARNLGNSADDTAFRGIHIEIRQAFDYLADGAQLDKCCEKYEFPPEEKVVFKRPTPGPRPVLTSSVPQPPRGGRNGGNRNGPRSNFGQKSSNYRRASSGAQFGNNRPPFLQSPPIQIPNQEYFNGNNIHDQLYQRYQLLEMQSNALRAQLLAVPYHLQAAHMQHAQALAQAQNRVSSHAGAYAGNGASSPHLSEAGPATSHPLQFLYPYPAHFDQAQSLAALSNDGSRTNPSSPSLASSAPNSRRAFHRSSVASEASTSSARSHSQPARSVANGVPIAGYPSIPLYDPAFMASYPLSRSPQEVAGQTNAEQQPPFTPTSVPAAPYLPEPATPSTPKEYVGYYMGESPQIRPQYQDYSVPPIPSFKELAQRRRKESSEHSTSLLTSSLKRASRSPSPLRNGHLGVDSTAPRSAPLPGQRNEQGDGGPVIVNGSNPAPYVPPVDHQAAANLAVDEGFSGDEPSYDTVSRPFPAYQDQFLMEDRAPEHPQPHLYAAELLQRHNIADLGASAINGMTTHGSPTRFDSPPVVTSSMHGYSPTLQSSGPQNLHMNGDSKHRADNSSPTPKHQLPWRSNKVNGVTPLDMSQVTGDASQASKSAGVPLLSPVFEARTPSPTTSRTLEASSSKNHTPSSLSKAVDNTHGKEKQQHQRSSANGKESSRSGQQKENNSSGHQKSNQGGGAPSSGNWQKAGTGKKRRARAKSGANHHKSHGDSKTGGEPLPVNEADRKGG